MAANKKGYKKAAEAGNQAGAQAGAGGSAGSSAAKEMSKDEQVGFYKGSLTVLAKERQELQRILGIVEQLMQMHLSELKRMGVDLSKEATAAAKPDNPQEKKPPIDELL